MPGKPRIKAQHHYTDDLECLTCQVPSGCNESDPRCRLRAEAVAAVFVATLKRQVMRGVVEARG